MQSVMNHNFSQAMAPKMSRSMFDRSHGLKTTYDAGLIVPILVDEALPTDTITAKVSHMVRMATPITPVMDNIHHELFFFAVPYRLVWANFKKFMGEQINPGDSVSYLVPQSTAPAGGYLEGSLQDYMGLPTKIAGYLHNTLHTRAYNLIWNEWFRDENLQNSLTVDTGDGADTVTNYVIRKRNKKHDYFTSMLPWPQKGTAVSLPLGIQAPVKFDQIASSTNDGKNAQLIRTGGAYQTYMGTAFGTLGNPITDNTNYDLYADLSTATASTIDQLLTAFATQHLYARDARGGTRYTEIILSHFGCQSSDARLQRPELLGYVYSKININPIAQTSVTAATPQGNLAAIGYSANSGRAINKTFEEHCVIIGLANVRVDLTYQQGLDKMWSRQTKLEYFWPSLANLGEQAVLSKELYCDGTGSDANVTGYQERWAEYRYKQSRVTGLFRSNATGTLHSWHLSEQFGSRPTLNSTFIEDSSATTIDRVIAVPSQPQFIADYWFDYKHARPLPVYSIPSIGRL
jgi:hypothetical protein